MIIIFKTHLSCSYSLEMHRRDDPNGHSYFNIPTAIISDISFSLLAQNIDCDDNSSLNYTATAASESASTTNVTVTVEKRIFATALFGHRHFWSLFMCRAGINAHCSKSLF